MSFRDLLYLRKSDRHALLFLLLVILIILGTICFVGGRNDKTSVTVADTLAQDDSLCRNYGGYGKGYYGHSGRRRSSSVQYYAVEGRKAELFYFDPNTADSTQLLRLGLKPWQVRNIYKYRAAGGIYRKPSDLSRLYGLTVKQYKALAPYIRISPDYQPAATLYDKKEDEKPYERDTVKLHAGETLPLNTSDTTMLKKVPGIGSAYSRAIVGYRERLGGFHDVSQLLEIDGIPESCLAYFSVGSQPLRKININKFTLNQLKRHPYMGFFRAKAIHDYRRINGNITSLSQLSLCRDFTPEAIKRLEPYVEY